MFEKHDLDLMLEYQLQGMHVEARKLSDKLESLGADGIKDPNGNNTTDIWLRHCFNRGWFLLQEGKYQEGCQLLENGRFLSVYGNPPPQTQAALYNPEVHDIEGKSIILVSEGGIGDEIIHARFVQSFKRLGASKVYVSCLPELLSVFERIEGVDGVTTRNNIDRLAPDYWVPGFSAGWVAGHTFEDLPNKPYLSARPESVDMWSNFIPDNKKPRVGIRWAGNPKFEHQQFRRFPPKFLTNIVNYDIDVHSFQRDHNMVELPEGINDLQHGLISWEDTAAAIMNMDLIITSCTSVAHMSAAMGKETWVITPVLPYHTWTWNSPESTTSPYYESVRVFRQKEFGKWDETFREVYAALEERFGLGHVDLPNEDIEPKKLNLGSGRYSMPDAVNADIDPSVSPDVVVDLSQTPWPWKDSEFSHITATNILQYIGDTPDDLVNVIKEMYRVSSNGAMWLIQVPHPRSDKFLADIYAKHTITPALFNLFDQRLLMDEKIVKNDTTNLLGYIHDMDLSIADVQYRYEPQWSSLIESGETTHDQMMHAVSSFNNVVSQMLITVQVHKAPRYTRKEFEDGLELEASRFKAFLNK